MFISPVNYINFTGTTKYVPGCGDTRKEQARYLDKEARQAYKARTNGVNVPVYSAEIISKIHPDITIKYTVDGDMPDADKNPVTNEHIKNLFENFIKLEEIGLCYDRLTPDNVYYGKNGKVEIDSLRNAQNFSINKDDDLFTLPSNADAYEAGGLCYYVDSFQDKYRQHGFLRCYLQQKGRYHAQRAEQLAKLGFKPNSKAVSVEDIKGGALKNLSSEMINRTKDKFEIYILKNEAEKEWRDGNIFADGKAKPKKRFISCIFNFEALKRAIALEEKTNTLSKDLRDRYEREYFALETKQIGALKQEIIKIIEETGSLNFADERYGKQGLYLGTKADKEFYDKTFKTLKNDIKEGKSAENINKTIDILEDFYRNRIAEWKLEKNKIYKQTYIGGKASIIPIEQQPSTGARIYSKQAHTHFN